MQKRRVVVTGIGMLSPLANDAEQSWQRALAGESGITTISHFDTGDCPVKISGAVRDLDLSAFLTSRQIKIMDPFLHYGMIAGLQAIADAGLTPEVENSERIGVIIGSGMGGISGIELSMKGRYEPKGRRMSPFFVPSVIGNMIAGHLSIEIGARGVNYAIVSACSTGAHSIGAAMDIIRLDRADVMLAGGAEMASTCTGMDGFAAARALSLRNDEPQRASRPWDKDRDGFVLSDGAGVMVLEEYEHAQQRGAHILAELIGHGASSDAFHITAPSEDGEGAVLCMRNALHDAGISAEQVGYINAHGTSTPVGDLIEVQAIKRTFGDHAYKLAVSSTKSMTGHTLGAAGAIEAIFCVQALRDQKLPPTINLDQPDEGCDLDFVPHHSRTVSCDIALSNSFGFGGTNACLIFQRYDT